MLRSDPDSSNNPELNCALPLDNEIVFTVGHGAQNDVYLLPKGSVRKWRNCTFLHSVRSSPIATTLSREEKFKTSPLFFSSSELSAHQMAPSGVIAH